MPEIVKGFVGGNFKRLELYIIFLSKYSSAKPLTVNSIERDAQKIEIFTHARDCSTLAKIPHNIKLASKI